MNIYLLTSHCLLFSICIGWYLSWSKSAHPYDNWDLFCCLTICLVYVGFAVCPDPGSAFISANSLCFLLSCLKMLSSHQWRTSPGLSTCRGHTVAGGLGWLLPLADPRLKLSSETLQTSLFSSRRGGQPSPKEMLIYYFCTEQQSQSSLSKVDTPLTA